jgi:alpha-L-arabinofuranosidase
MKKFLRTAFLVPLAILVAVTAFGQTTGTLTVQVNEPGAVVSSNLFGIFFEEINYGGEGGIYAEMVRNRAFYNPTNAEFWTLVTQASASGTMSIDSAQPLNTNSPYAMKLTMASGTGSVGAGNGGFWGMSLQAGASYDLNLYARASNNFSGTLQAKLESPDGATLYAQTSFSGLQSNWNRFSASLVSSGSATNARLVISIPQPGTVWLDEVSLFPRATFNNRTNGLRLDLANKLSELKPSFFRFPGGNFIESWTVTNAVRWKKSIGEPINRPGHMNDSWGYWSTDGFGAHEFFQFCEDLGMEPLYGINAGLMLGYNGGAGNTVPLAEMGPWVQDALDLIEYANGDTNTTYGAMRAANGHPAPFHLKYMEIGNENGGTYYDNRYTLFYDAIKAKYPDMHLIACGNWSGGMPWSRPVEIEDEHYYSSPATFISYATKYDNYSRTGPKVFVGEYAVTSGYGAYGNLSAALGEAAFMTGMERNADIVAMACYAPLFANVNGIQWHPDLIYYDNSRSFGTPSYYVQKLFSENRGDAILPTSASVVPTAPVSPPRGAIGLGSWSTAVQYTNIVVTSNGVTLYSSDFVNNGTNGWRVFNGSWITNAGLYQQTSSSATDCRSTTGNTNWANYTISLRARKVSGAEGFLILFNWTDDNNWTWWNVGGWGNTKDGIEQMVAGSKSTLGQVNQTAIATNTWYDIAIVVSNYTINCYLNGALMQTVNYSSNATSGVYASSTYSRATGQIIVKAVNPYAVPVATTFNLVGVNSIASTGTVIQLTSANPMDENSLTAPAKILPVTNSISGLSPNFVYTLPAYSLSVIGLAASDINAYTNLALQFASPISTGQAVASTVLAQQSGNWFDLTANTNHAIVWSSADTNIATVNTSGIINGVAPGTTQIVAQYPSLGLSATQQVRVFFELSKLVHRYSFSEVSGTNVADSVGGLMWQGTLPNGGTFANGQLSLAAGSSQFVDLPPGILSNYTKVTIDVWAAFGTLPNNCFLYGFGNKNGSVGEDYIFCQPKDGRIAITDGNWTGEQGTGDGGNWSGQTVHITSVFNPPAGYVALYTNGVLASQNNAITKSLTSVSNVFSYIARSLYSGDAYFNVSLDEFRIYSGVLSAAEIATAHALGPDQTLSDEIPFVSASLTEGNLTLSWPATHLGWILQVQTNSLGMGLGANWIDIAGSDAITSTNISMNATNPAVFFRLRHP